MSEDSSLQSGHIRARPVRIAFLIEDSEHSDTLLSSIFAFCHSCWGGRYFLVVPCRGGKPEPEWCEWLKLYDPDIVYSYINLSDDVTFSLYEEYGPALIREHEPLDKGKRDQRYFRPKLPMDCLSSLSVALLYARAHPPSAPRPITVPDYMPGEPGNRFIDDNFGCASECLGWPIPTSLADVVKPVHIASAETIAANQRNTRRGTAIVQDEIELLKLFVENRNSYGLAQLAADSTPRLDFRSGLEENFALVVGESFDDKLYFWNRRGLFPAYLGRQFCTLIVSPGRFEDQSFVDCLRGFLAKRNETFISGTPWIDLVSCSLAPEQLTTIREKLSSGQKWINYSLRGSMDLGSLPPSNLSRGAVGDLVLGQGLMRAAPWQKFKISDHQVALPKPVPEHLAGVQVDLRATSGSWALDIEIQHEEHDGFVPGLWMLPRRLPMHNAFCDTYMERGTRDIRYSRTTDTGRLALFTGWSGELPAIRIPREEDAIKFALIRGRRWESPSRKKKVGFEEGPYAFVGPSDKGRYLTGVLRLFGGLEEAKAALLHKYWKDVFADLGGARSSERHEAIRARLHDRFRSGQISTEPEWNRLVKLVASEAQKVRMPSTSRNFSQLNERHERLFSAELAVLEQGDILDPEEQDRWIQRAKDSLRRSVQWLCDRSVLYQGYSWRCKTCYHTNWNGVEQLRKRVVCDVCGREELCPVDRPWDFTLNEFLREALKEHGLSPLVWCLSILEKRARKSFFFVGPLNLWVDYPPDTSSLPDNEADLICAVDHLVYLCEVKSSDRDFDVEALIKVALRVRPDVVMIAVMDATVKKATAKLAIVNDRLRGTGIRAELVSLDEGRHFDERPYLPTGDW